MKKSIIHITIALFLIVIVDKISSIIFDTFYKKQLSGQSGGKINAYLKSETNHELLILGDSRALYQVIPDSLNPEAFNLSHAGMGLSFQSALLHVLISNHKKPKNILIHIDPDQFLIQKNTLGDRSVLQLRYYYKSDAFVKKYIDELGFEEKFKFLFSSYRHNGKLFSEIKNGVFPLRLNSSLNGYEPSLPEVQDSSNVMYMAQKEKEPKDPTFNMQYFHYVTDIVLQCRKNRIGIYFFTAPTFVYLNFQKKFSREISDYLKKNNTPYFNSNEFNESWKNNPSNWKDARHLNHNGAQLFSREIGNWYKQLQKSR